jgi:hypothetical protein
LYFIWINFFGSNLTSHLLALVTYFYSKKTSPKFITNYSKIQKYFNEKLPAVIRALDTLKEYDLISYKEQLDKSIEVYINYNAIDNFALPLNQPSYEQDQSLNNYYGINIYNIECPHCDEKLDNDFLKFVKKYS